MREKIERRYAQALGSQELVENSVQGRMSEIESAGNDMRASSRLEEIRAQLNAENGANALEQGEGSGNGTGEGALRPSRRARARRQAPDRCARRRGVRGDSQRDHPGRGSARFDGRVW
ncbi:PspA/IM30 family protein, partial [Kytococcus schroeteri]|uniref:PspA/IM30 family protein n=1 Tax=Kytococcus schroeteri TaxID=138300 RepID=UPI0039C07188